MEVSEQLEYERYCGGFSDAYLSGSVWYRMIGDNVLMLYVMLGMMEYFPEEMEEYMWKLMF